MFKIIKINKKKKGILHGSPRGCDVAAPRGPARMCLRDTEVTCIIIFILYTVHSKYKHSIEEFKLTAIYLIVYIPDASPKFPPCGIILLSCFDFRMHGTARIVGSMSRGMSRVDHVESRSTGSLIKNVLQIQFK